jgi:hypothetical protein
MLHHIEGKIIAAIKTPYYHVQEKDGFQIRQFPPQQQGRTSSQY